MAEAIAIVVGLAVGAYAGWRRGGRADRIGSGISLILYSMPYFVIGMPLIVIFASGLGWFPTSGMLTVGATYPSFVDRLIDFGRHLALPPGDRVARADRRLLDPDALVDHRDPLRGLHHDGAGQGLTDRRVLRAHAFPNAMLPMVTIIAINLGYVVGGAITAEVVFNWPGLGTLTVDALSARDYPVLEGVFLLLSVTVVLANLAADLVYGLLDPRVRA